MKKLGLTMLVTILVLAMAVPAMAGGIGPGGMGPGGAKKFFQDEDLASWAQTHMAAANLKGFLKGDPDGRFRPNDPLKRAEMVTAAIRFANLEEAAQAWKNAALDFEDAAEIGQKFSWAVGYLGQAAKSGLIPGVGRFQPERPADRLWAAEVLVKALGLEEEAQAKMGAELDFKDVANIPADKIGYLAVALEKGILQGYPDGTFQPQKPVTRAELSTLLGRADEKKSWLGRHEVRGTVIGVVYGDAPAIMLGPDPDLKTFAMEPERTYKVSPDAVIVANGQKAGLEDVKVGYRARLVLNGEGTALLVMAREPKEEPVKEMKLRGWLVELPALEGREVYGLVTGNRFGAMKMKGPGARILAERAGELKALVLVPGDDAVAGELKANLGQLVAVRGQALKGPNIYMRPVFRVVELRPLERQPEPTPQPPEQPAPQPAPQPTPQPAQ